MEYLNILNDIEQNTSIVLVILPLSITALSYLLAIVEYYELKAWWDYFYIDDIGRKSMRSGFHPEYLSYGFIILLFLLSLAPIFSNIICMPINPFNAILKESIKVLFGLIILIFSVTFLKTYVFCSPNIKELGIYKSLKEYSKFVFIISTRKTIPFAFFLLIILASILLYKQYGEIYILPMTIIVLSICFIGFYYSGTKKIIKYTKWFYIVDDEHYVILATNNGLHYTVEYRLENDKMQLFVDSIKLFPIGSVQYRKIFIRSFTRWSNNRSCDEYKGLLIKLKLLFRGKPSMAASEQESDQLHLTMRSRGGT